MELTTSERQALDTIRLEYIGARYQWGDLELRPLSKAEYRVKRDKLDALEKAWSALDRNTQWHLVCGLKDMWVDEAEDLLPEIAPVVAGLLEAMKKPNGSPEQVPGLGRATALLWSFWCADQPGGHVPIGRAAVAEISAEISSLFEMDATEAERRVRHALRSMEKEGTLPRRGTTRRE